MNIQDACCVGFNRALMGSLYKNPSEKKRSGMLRVKTAVEMISNLRKQQTALEDFSALHPFLRFWLAT